MILVPRLAERARALCSKLPNLATVLSMDAGFCHFEEGGRAPCCPGGENHPTIILGMDEIILGMDEIILVG